jgi:hypothetical protein
LVIEILLGGELGGSQFLLGDVQVHVGLVDKPKKEISGMGKNG